MLTMGQPHFLKQFSLSHSLKHLIPEFLYPSKPETYLLMSEKNSITDWHVDYSGSAVYYEVLSGLKEVVFVDPTAHNQKVFEEYLNNSKLVNYFMRKFCNSINWFL